MTSDLNLHKLIDTKVKDSNYERVFPTGWPDLSKDEINMSGGQISWMGGIVEIPAPPIGEEQKGVAGFRLSHATANTITAVIDWGDGGALQVTNITTSLVTFQKQYSYSNTNLINTPNGKLAKFRVIFLAYNTYNSELSFYENAVSGNATSFPDNFDGTFTPTGGLSGGVTSLAELFIFKDNSFTTFGTTSSNYTWRNLRYLTIINGYSYYPGDPEPFQNFTPHQLPTLAATSLPSLERLDLRAYLPNTPTTSLFAAADNLTFAAFYGFSYGNYGSLFSGCGNLKLITIYEDSSSNACTFNNGSNLMPSNMLSSCFSLRELPKWGSPLPSLAGFLGTAYNTMVRIRSFNIGGGTYTINYCYFLNREALVEIFENLATEARTIVITNCIGTADLTTEDRAIATDKGWTITG